MQQTPEVDQIEEEPPMLVAARTYFAAIANESTILRDEMTGAKTRTKAAYFKKKLTENNKVALQLLERITVLEKSKAKIRELSNEEADEVEEVNEYR